MSPYFKGIDKSRRSVETKAFYLNPVEIGSSLNFS